MAKDFVIGIYLFCFNLLFSLCKLFPLKNKATFVSSIGENCQFVLEEMVRQQAPVKRVVLNKGKSKIEMKDDGDTIVLHFESLHIIEMLRSIFHLATSRWIIVDNYFGFLSAVSFKKEVTCTQVWHAAGAVKKFGLQDPSVKFRSKKAQKRFKNVYQQFDYVTIGSEKMAGIFKESFGIEENNILRTGIPRTDFFFDMAARQSALDKIYASFPELTHKKTLLYAPTYRESDLHEGYQLGLDIDLLYKELANEDYAVLLKLHPAVSATNRFAEKYPGFVYTIGNEFPVNEWLLAADLLITDYSSLPFEYSLLGKPMIFFAYDLKSYEKERGFWEDYHQSMPGPVVTETLEIIQKIRDNDLKTDKIIPFRNEWNQYSTGSSSKNLVDVLFKK
ncbi:CDP-glycerol glycerophosphotransferase family protein [Bacillus massiliglaciei]|uniref:CDP-glycerol glycerophosphotransferase family protein n=1 Tax=Bacillus massiliglaciei TaxID=1816693 RepID=UPI000DA61349|nr:CDP-glycerol glycerophosphotransferase family protein [Bacillus massiliglaciei]